MTRRGSGGDWDAEIFEGESEVVEIVQKSSEIRSVLLQGARGDLFDFGSYRLEEGGFVSFVFEKNGRGEPAESYDFLSIEKTAKFAHTPDSVLIGAGSVVGFLVKEEVPHDVFDGDPATLHKISPLDDNVSRRRADQ